MEQPVILSKIVTAFNRRMRVIVSNDDRGFSLIELMVSLVILSVSLLALLSVIITSIQVNRQNDLRNAAIRLTGETAENFLSTPIDSIAIGGPTSTTLSVKIRTGTVSYTVSSFVSLLSNDLKQINITVSYPFNGQTYSNQSVIYKHRAI